MLYREIIAVCSQIHTKHINAPWGQNVELSNVKLVVHIVTTAIQSVEVYRICICWSFTKYNNNIAGCLHSIKRTSSVPNATVCLCDIKRSVDSDRWKKCRAA